MISQKEIERINTLWHKSQTPEGLTVEEKDEQQLLRRKYIDSVKINLRAQLDNIDILENDGTVTSPGSKQD